MLQPFSVGRRRNSGDGPGGGTAAAAAALLLAALAVSLPASAASPAPGKAGGKAARKAPDSPGEPPVMEGRLRPRQLINAGPEWSRGYSDYEPEQASLEMIRSFSRTLRGDLQLEVVVGTWCSDSRRHVPRFIKIQRSLKQDRLPVTFWGVDRSKKSPAESVEGRDIEKVPTFIVKYKGQEVGRIVETPNVSVEADLAEILAGAGKS